MKKLLLIIESLESGGAQRQLVGLAKFLKDKGYQVKLIYYYPLEFYKSYLDKFAIDNEYVRNATNRYKRIFNIYKTVKEYSPTVVISYQNGPNMLACILKYVGLEFKLITSERNTSQDLNLRERLKFFLMRQSDVVVTNSFSQKMFINNYYPAILKKTIVITNFVDTEIFCPSSTSSKSTEKKTCKILCVGRLVEQKNVLRFLDALCCLKEKAWDFHVDWYGEKMDLNYYIRCVEKVKMLKLEDTISFKEPTKDIVKVYQGFDAFCLPSIYEGFPNVLCEAMSCGLPILCSNVCDNPKIVRDNGLLFDPYNPADIANKITFFFKLSLAEKRVMREKSRFYALKDFSVNSFVEKYEQIL